MRLSKNKSSCRHGVALLGVLLVATVLADDSRTPKPTESELAQLVGQRMPSAFTSVEWKATEPPQVTTSPQP